jgi:cytochrome b pre-mRNA-processing protein 3
MILARFRPSSRGGTIHDLYGAIVAQARSSAFYASYGVPDTVQGRFDLIVLHLVLLLDRLNQDHSVGRDAGQKLFDLFCSDLDANLREMGVGDLAVPKEMRRFAEAFYGRQTAYLAALASPDEQDLERALARNIFQDVGGNAGARRLAQYTRAVLRQVVAQDETPLLRGKITYPSPESIAHE